MKMIKKGLIFLLALVLLFPSQALAKSLTKEGYYAYGESLTEEQKKTTARLLNVEDGAKEMEVKIKELNGLLHDTYDYYQVYSSVYLKANEGGGIEVDILTPDTITAITDKQYANAAMTAGATDALIRVASVKAVDGSGALAGVYKAYKEMGYELPEENIIVAQKELTTTSSISQENKGKEGYSDELLNAALADIKATIQEQKSQGITVNIGEIVNNVINNYNLQDVLTEDNMKSINGLMEQFKNIQITEEQKTALVEFAGKLKDEGGKLFDNVKSSWDEVDPETKENMKGFFANLWDMIVQFFNNLFS